MSVFSHLVSRFGPGYIPPLSIPGRVVPSGNFFVWKKVTDDFVTSEYKKTGVRGEMSRYNYEAQEAGKTFKISQMIHTKKV
jgi:hypothetical protein